MDQEAIVSSFNRQTPHDIVMKPDSNGLSYSPWDYMPILAIGGGIILAILLLIALFVGPQSLWVAAIVASLLAGLGLWAGIFSLWDVLVHRRLARYGNAVLGRVTSKTSVLECNDTPIMAMKVTVKYEYQMPSGEVLTGERNTISGWSEKLEQDGPVIVVYLPHRPKRHEPYDSLLYTVRM